MRRTDIDTWNCREESPRELGRQSSQTAIESVRAYAGNGKNDACRAQCPLAGTTNEVNNPDGTKRLAPKDPEVGYTPPQGEPLSGFSNLDSYRSLRPNYNIDYRTRSTGVRAPAFRADNRNSESGET